MFLDFMKLVKLTMLIKESMDHLKRIATIVAGTNIVMEPFPTLSKLNLMKLTQLIKLIVLKSWESRMLTLRKVL